MRKSGISVGWALALLLASAAAPAAGVEGRGQETGFVRLELPAAWRAELRTSGPAFHAEVFVPGSEEYPQLLVTIARLPPGQVDGTEEERAQRMARTGGEELLPTALQERIEVRRLPLAAGSLYWYHLTDRVPERGPGDFREMRQGVGLVQGHLVTFTILTHTGEDAVVESALAALGTLTISN